MNLSINAMSLAHGVLRLKNVVDLTHSMVDTASNNTLCGSYSGMSELSELGATHGCVLYGSVGSAMMVAQSLAEQIDWGRHTLDLNRQSFLGQDCIFSKALTSCDVQHMVDQIHATYVPHPTPCFADFHFPTPIPTIPVSLDEVIARLTNTNHAQAHQALSSWTTMSSLSHQASVELKSIADDLLKENSGDAICAAHKTITAMAATTEAFSLTSAGMAGTVGYLAAIALAFLPGLMTARTLLLAVPEPAEREAAEAAILVKFRALFSQALMGAVPVIRNLTHVLSAVGDGMVRLAGGNGSDAHPPIEKLGQEMSESAVELVRCPSHNEYEAHAESHTGSAAKLHTDAANGSAYSGSYVNASMGASFQGAAEVSSGGMSSTGIGSSGSLGSSGSVGSVGTVEPIGIGGLPHSGGGVGSSALTAAHIATQPAGVDPQTASAGPQLGARNAAATGFPGFLGGAHGRPARHAAPSHSPAPSNVIAQVAARTTQSLPVSQSSQYSPIIPESVSNQTPKIGKVRGVLQHAPLTANARALLGDNPATVPGVIGVWVRITPPRTHIQRL